MFYVKNRVVFLRSVLLYIIHPYTINSIINQCNRLQKMISYYFFQSVEDTYKRKDNHHKPAPCLLTQSS